MIEDSISLSLTAMSRGKVLTRSHQFLLCDTTGNLNVCHQLRKVGVITCKTPQEHYFLSSTNNTQ